MDDAVAALIARKKVLHVSLQIAAKEFNIPEVTPILARSNSPPP